MNTLFNCSLWGDEAFSAVLAQEPFWPMIKIVAKDTSPPLMYIIMWFWFKIFGSSEIAIRSLSLLFYLGTVFIIYLIGKKLFDKKTGALAAILSFFNPFLFPYALEGRMYFCLLFFVTLSFYFLIKKNNWGYILSAAAALYSHHFAFFPIFSQFLWQLIFGLQCKEQNLWKTIQPYLVIGILYIPWLYPLYLQTTLVSTGFWLGNPKLKHLLGTFRNFLTHRTVFQIQTKIPILAGIILALRKWRRKNLKTDFLLLSWAILPPILTFLISQTKMSIFYERYLLYCVPPIMLLLASQVRKIGYFLIIPISFLFFLISSNYFLHPFKKPFRGFTTWIKENVSENIFIANYNGAAHHLWETKYYGIKAPIYSPGGPLPFYVGTAQMTEKDVVYQLPENQEIALVSSEHPDSMKIDNYQIDRYHKIDSLYFVWIKEK